MEGQKKKKYMGKKIQKKEKTFGITVDYGNGGRERYNLFDIALMEFGKGKDLFSPERMKELDLKPDNFYVVITKMDDVIDIFEPLVDVAVFFGM